jgi:hypothetical protein
MKARAKVGLAKLVSRTLLPAAAMGILLLLPGQLRAADNLRINPKLDYSSDSIDGPLITGDHVEDGAAAGKPNYILIYGEGCFNSKRQARRTVELYEHYRDRVNFVVIDLDKPLPPTHLQLVQKYHDGYIPHVVVLDAAGTPAYNRSGEVDSSRISALLDRLLR